MHRERLIIHCSDTRNGRRTTAREIDRWHAARGDMKQRDEDALLRFAPQYPYCGYHGVIELDGRLVRTRAETEPGSHCAGYNSGSLGFCLAGTDAFTLEQWDSLANIVRDCIKRWGDIEIAGHREFNMEKTCPGFSVSDWLIAGMVALPDHILKG